MNCEKKTLAKIEGSIPGLHAENQLLGYPGSGRNGALEYGIIKYLTFSFGHEDKDLQRGQFYN